MKCYAKSSENLIVQLANLPPKPPFLSKSFHLFSCTGKTHYLCISSAKNKEQNKTFLPFNFQNIGRQLVQYAASKSDYIQIRQGETKTILPGELCRQQIYTFDASIRIYLITPFEEAYEIRYINTDRLNYYQSEPVPILYSKEDHESSKVQTTQVRQYSIHGGIKGTIKDNFPEVARDLED